MFDFAGLPLTSQRTMRRYSGEKLFDDRWVRMSEFLALDDDRLQAHAEAFGGDFRVRDGERIVKQWKDGKLVEATVE